MLIPSQEPPLLLPKEADPLLTPLPSTMVGQSPREAGEGRAPVLLEPFVHQVGGHMSMMKYDEQTVCKPLVTQELSFYQSLPLAMRQFTPQYKGIVSVHLKKDSLGNLTLMASPSLQAESCARLEKAIGDTSVTIWHKWAASTEHTLVTWSHTQLTKTFKESCPGKVLLRTDLQYHPDSLLEDAKGKQGERNSYNPWGLHCHRQHLTRMSSKHNENKLHQFLLLENVVSKYNFPCILDLKMGTRQHGDDASEEKKARHIKKCEQSTSASLGVRICGMQVYQADTGHFLCKDKYYGRKLSPEGFRQTLHQFLCNGNHLRTDLLEPIILRLKALLAVIRKQSSYRFYSSSLLIIYEGQEQKENSASLDNHLHIPKPSYPSRVDVRMIDFAHTTFKGSKCEQDGPDQGYIFGLENLIRILQNISESK
ncbi:inositol hexakisphosphate kinase 3 [Calypte anna]|uniref:inositol hexakisphosphate kinase 3 n=1 Tax=Calypte anna TaxID=9244 RepID=UPI0011C350CF|nr:inositol hexakisphosphate kinase 3 [Calypte anna]XP_030321324.1 inositol hexakisphosphate kinase 3 [Calypte anna]